MKKLLLLIFIIIYANAANPISLQYMDIDVEHIYLNGEKEKFKIQRVVDKNCINIPMSPESFNDENIEKNIAKECKRTFITTKGVIQPLYINDKIKTLAEIEVLDFIHNKSSKEPKKYALIDTRKSAWFKDETIPSALNVPFEDLAYDEDFKEEFNKAYSNLGIKVVDLEKNIFDFTNAKTVVFFCNGPWCPISGKTINYLLELGYPADKIMWYRGGMLDWSAMSLSTTKK
ncbi:rhodanese-like domain-containing protein [Arcobacter sp. s6]|uniref:rhodanese-like domain-containing protein n=1 Tax=Arcobacter sp. s6 TaxID=3230363 RepID=UPI0034A02F52